MEWRLKMDDMTIDVSNKVLRFITRKELRLPPGRIYDVDFNTIINIPEGKILLITSDPYTTRRFGISVCPSPIILTADRGSNFISIPIIWDGDHRGTYNTDWHGNIKISSTVEGICIAKAVLIDLPQYQYNFSNK